LLGLVGVGASVEGGSRAFRFHSEREDRLLKAAWACVSPRADIVERMSRVSMVEFPSTSASRSAEFFGQVFGWQFNAYGPQYTDVAFGGGFSLGFQQDADEAPAAPLVVIKVNDLDSARRSIESHGGRVTVEPFDFPGGRRFHFVEPGGNELAAWVEIHR
jgi:predicted enzyme related to lactoylglutathione lyase